MLCSFFLFISQIKQNIFFISRGKSDTCETLQFGTAKSTLASRTEVPPGLIELVEHCGTGDSVTISGHVTAIMRLNLPFKDQDYTDELIGLHSARFTGQKSEQIYKKLNYIGNGYIHLTLDNDIPRHLISDILNDKGWKLLGYSVSTSYRGGNVIAEKWGQKSRERKKSESPREKTPRSSSRRRSSGVSVLDEETSGSRRSSSVSLGDDIAEFLERRDKRRDRRHSGPPAIEECVNKIK